MRLATETFVLDTSALFCLRDDEPGASRVDDVIRRHGDQGRVYISFMSLMELGYVIEREEGEAQVHRDILQIKQLPLRVVESDAALGLAAARIKASNRLSVADAWIAATAQRLDATLVHKDSEFDALAGMIRLDQLPRK